MCAGQIDGASGQRVYAHPRLCRAGECDMRDSLCKEAALMLFLLAAMTFVNAMSDRKVFVALRGLLIRRNLGFRKLFWVTGFLAFFLSPVIDNLTTALEIGRAHV